jgi:hypothetical protein
VPPKEVTRENYGSWKKLAAAHRGTTNCAKVTRHKGNIGKNWTGDNVVHGTPKRWTFRKRHQLKPERKMEIRYQGPRQQLQSNREFTKIYRKTNGLQIAKRIAKSTVGLQTIKDWTLWKGRSPLKRKDVAHGVRVGNVGTQAIRDSSAPLLEKKNSG